MFLLDGLVICCKTVSLIVISNKLLTVAHYRGRMVIQLLNTE